MKKLNEIPLTLASPLQKQYEAHHISPLTNLDRHQQASTFQNNLSYLSSPESAPKSAEFQRLSAGCRSLPLSVWLSIGVGKI